MKEVSPMKTLSATLLVLLLTAGAVNAAVTTFGDPGPERPPQAPVRVEGPQAP